MWMSARQIAQVCLRKCQVEQKETRPHGTNATPFHGWMRHTSQQLPAGGSACDVKAQLCATGDDVVARMIVLVVFIASGCVVARLQSIGVCADAVARGTQELHSCLDPASKRAQSGPVILLWQSRFYLNYYHNQPLKLNLTPFVVLLSVIDLCSAQRTGLEWRHSKVGGSFLIAPYDAVMPGPHRPLYAYSILCHTFSRPVISRSAIWSVVFTSCILAHIFSCFAFLCPAFWCSDFWNLLFWRLMDSSELSWTRVILDG